MTSSRAKAAERQAVLKKLQPLLKKHFKFALPKAERPVLETMLFAVCLENQSPDEAERCYARFRADFPDLNEARVSQVSELERAFSGLADSEWRGFRLRAALQFVFEKSFTFEFESLKKKTLDLAVKQLARLKHATPFIRSYTLQSALGAHLLPVDDSMRRLFVWMGLVEPTMSEDEIGEALKSSVRKAEAATFCLAIRLAATDEFVRTHVPEVSEAPPEGYDPTTAIARLQGLLDRTEPKVKPKPKAAPPAAAPAAKKTAASVKTESKTAPAKTKAVKPATRTKSS